MHDTAAHLVDRVIPQVPVRQWVLSLPRWARFLLARDPQLITRTLDVALRAIFAHQRLRARRAGALAPRVGAVTFVQRFGGALNLNVHFHCAIPDGVFVRENGRVELLPEHGRRGEQRFGLTRHGWNQHDAQAGAQREQRDYDGGNGDLARQATPGQRLGRVVHGHGQHARSEREGDRDLRSQQEEDDENAEAYSRSAYPEVLKALGKVVDGTPQLQTCEVSNSTIHKIAARA